MRPRLHLVRHGQSTWNAEGRLQGGTAQVPLTARGHEQARTAARGVAGLGVDALLTSDLLRAVQTAEVIGSALGLEPALEPALREQSLGTLEGRLARDLAAEPTPPGRHVCEVRWGGGESIADVHDRVGRFLSRLLTDPPGESVVLVSHGDTIRVALAWLAGRGPREVEWTTVANGSVTTVLPDGSGPAPTSPAATGVAGRDVLVRFLE